MRGKETIFEKLVSFPRAPIFPKNFQKAEGDFLYRKPPRQTTRRC